MLKKLAHPYLLLIFTALFWSGNMVVVRALNVAFPDNQPIPPITLALGRWLIVFLLTLPIAWKYKEQWRLLLSHWKILLILSICGICIFNTLAYVALQTTTATNAALLNSFIPIVTMLLGFMFLKQSINRVQFIGVLLSMMGVLTIISKGDFWQLLNLNINHGDLWMLLAVVDWAIYTTSLRWHPKINPLFLLFTITSIGLLFLLPFSLIELSLLDVKTQLFISKPNILTVIYIGIFPGFLGYVFYNFGVRKVGANRGSLFIHLMPIFSSALAWLFLDERFYFYHIIGIIGIFGGITLAIYTKIKT